MTIKSKAKKRTVTTDLQIARLPHEDGQPMYKVNGIEHLYVRKGKRATTFYVELATGSKRALTTKFHPTDYTKAKAAKDVELIRNGECIGSQQYESLRDSYIREHFPTLQTNTASKMARIIEIYLDPLFAGSHLPSFPKRRANDAIRKIRDKKWVHPETGILCGGHGPAAKVATQVRNLADWYFKEFDSKIALSEIDNEHLNIEPSKRGRILSRRELKLLFEALENSRTAERAKIAIYLLASLGVRTGDLLMAEWQDFSADFSYWDIPGWKHKSGQPLLIPIPQKVRPLFKRLFEIIGFNKVTAKRREKHQDGYWILGDLHPNGIAGAMDRLQDGFRYKTGVPLLQPEDGKINPHDLRRSFSTYLNSMQGTRPLVVEKCLGHVVKGIASTYNKSGYLQERAEYLTRYADCLEDPENLLPIPDSRIRMGDEGEVFEVEFKRLALPEGAE